MNKLLVMDHEKCTGCRNCEMACSVSHAQVSNPARSAVRVVKWVREELNVPVVCQQCEHPACANICPVQAISRDADTGALVIDHERCVGCRMCMVACPFGALAFDADLRRPVKCDLCGGVEPWCVRSCQPGALTFKRPVTASMDKKRAAGRRLLKAVGRSTAKGEW